MTTLDWTPPPGMKPKVISEWRAFYKSIHTAYGLTPAQYRALYLAQLGRCFICWKARGMHPDDPQGGGGRRLGVDHNHLMGSRPEAVRGLLCTGSLDPKTCNRLIAWYPIEALRRAITHLEEAPAQAVFAALEEGMPETDIEGMVYHP